MSYRQQYLLSTATRQQKELEILKLKLSSLLEIKSKQEPKGNAYQPEHRKNRSFNFDQILPLVASSKLERRSEDRVSFEQKSYEKGLNTIIAKIKQNIEIYDEERYHTVKVRRTMRSNQHFFQKAEIKKNSNEKEETPSDCIIKGLKLLPIVENKSKKTVEKSTYSNSPRKKSRRHKLVEIGTFDAWDTIEESDFLS